jgi:hypothetical protein
VFQKIIHLLACSAKGAQVSKRKQREHHILNILVQQAKHAKTLVVKVGFQALAHWGDELGEREREEKKKKKKEKNKNRNRTEKEKAKVRETPQ